MWNWRGWKGTEGFLGLKRYGPYVELMCWTEGVCVELRGTLMNKLAFLWHQIFEDSFFERPVPKLFMFEVTHLTKWLNFRSDPFLKSPNYEVINFEITNFSTDQFRGKISYEVTDLSNWPIFRSDSCPQSSVFKCTDFHSKVFSKWPGLTCPVASKNFSTFLVSQLFSLSFWNKSFFVPKN